MENLIFEQKNKLIARGLQLVALGDMLNSYGEFYIVAPLTGQCQIAHRIRSTL
jgi:hypothetical protein